MILQPSEPLIICDASPLILLAKISQAELVLKFADEVWIPDVVWHEITCKSGSQSEIPLLMKLLSHCVRPADAALMAAFQTQVDAGEAAALSLAARRPESVLLMDDRRGRILAKQQGMRCIGTLGLLVKAKRRGLLNAIRPLLNELRTQGMFVSNELENESLKAADELN